MKNKFLFLACLVCLSGNNCLAYDSYEVDTGNYTYNFSILNAGEVIGSGENSMAANFDIPQDLRYPIFTSAEHWGEIITNDSSTKPVTYLIFGSDEEQFSNNAAALSTAVTVAESPYKVTQVNAAIRNLTITGGIDPDDPDYNGFIFVGRDGEDHNKVIWAPYSGRHSLYHGELPDFHSVILHEFMHSLGITTGAQRFNEDKGDDTFYFSKNTTDPLYIMDKDLRIYQGSYDAPFDETLEIKPENGMSVGKGKEFDKDTYTPYYTGEETLKVLASKDNYYDAKQAIINNGGLINYSGKYKRNTEPGNGYKPVYGLPIHPSDRDGEIDLAHIELRNSYMSHQDFRNWLIPMEAELAALKDLGYEIDLRKHFGKSYYLNNITDTFTGGYSEWNGTSYTGTPSTVNQGVGLHIYGKNNNITQNCDILTGGEGSFGVRIDGENNTFTLSSGSTIQTSGVDNLGLAVTWGKNHIVNVQSGSEISAIADDGIAVSFDFGQNLFGTQEADARGSYISYSGDFSMDTTPEEETRGALVEEFNVAGTLSGKKAAIYISDNAHVKNINILNGAQINGDIVSEWNSTDSAGKFKVLKDNGSGEWVPVNPEIQSEIYFTDINVDNLFDGTINGNINGGLVNINTLRLNNAGNLTVSGEEITVNTINNIGNINIDSSKITAQNGMITGNGNIVVSNKLNLGAGMSSIGNVVYLESGSSLSTINDQFADITISKLNSDNAKLSFDLGDSFTLLNASDTNTASLGQIYAAEEKASVLQDGETITLFGNDTNTLNLGTSEANVYYNGNKYTLSQSSASPDLLDVKLTATNTELSDAVEDPSAANYIVTESQLTKAAGEVNGDTFEISGKDININGNTGLVVDGTKNKSTTISTGIYGASDSDITVKNGGNLTLSAVNGSTVIGTKGKTAVKTDNSTVNLDADDNSIIMGGKIQGTNSETINASGKFVIFDETDNVTIVTRNDLTNLNNTSKNTVWNSYSNELFVTNDSYLSSDGTNSLTMNGGTINLANGKASDITLSSMTLNDTIGAGIDIDLKNLTTDRFVFQNSDDLQTNNFDLVITGINTVNPNAILTSKTYSIPFVSSAYHNEALLDSVSSQITKDILSPIFKYHLEYQENDNTGNFVLSRGGSESYNCVNPAVMVAPVAAHLGGYFTQLNAYDQAFQNFDMKTLMTREERQAYKMANLYASTVTPRVFSETYLPEKDSALWFRPYASFEKVKLDNGPKVGNTMYGSYFGGDSPLYETKYGIDFQYSVYAGYNGSHQHYSGNSIYQNGGTFGATGMFYKGNLFTAVTANIGAGVAEASTMYGSEDFTMLMTGIASKTGYNFEFAKGKFIVQPNYLASYSFVNTFDYRNAAGVKITSDPLNAFNIAPGIKLIGNLKNSWQPYFSAQMVWSLMDDTHFEAQNVNLPELSVKPYVQYGLGIQKRWGERFTGFFQAMARNGGRSGVALSLGLRWTLGK